MKAEEFEKEFLSMPENEQMEIMRKIMPVFCQNMAGDPKKAREMFSLLTEESGGHMSNMMSMMGPKGRGCCG